MYSTFYGLNKRPFEISPDPEFLWLSEIHKEAFAHLRYGILESKGFLLITGDVGTGKTALIKRLVKLINVAAIVVTIPDPDMSKLDFFNFLGNELGMGRTFRSKGEFLIYFKNFMLSAYQSHKKVLLIIDEAQRLNHELLLEISILSNLDFEGQMLLNVFFVGQTEFKKLLMDDRNQTVRNKISLNYHLDPLKKEEVSQYIRHRLRVAGQSKEIFTSDAIRKIYALSKGYPRLINIICDRALLTGYGKGLKRVGANIIKECGKELAITIGSYRTKKQKTPPLQKEKPLSDNTPPKRSLIRTAPIMLPLLMSCGFFVYIFSDTLFSNSPTRTNEKAEIQESYRPLESYREDTSGETTDPAQMGLTVENIFEPENESDPQIDELSSALASLNTEQKKKFIVYYEYDSSDIQPPAVKQLNHISNIFFNSPLVELTIRGFTDSFGSENYNKYISAERANSVKKYFTNKGIPASKIKVIGMGAGISSGFDMTLEERRKNRRVEIEIRADKQQKP
jgi:general secretion pathway protein A